jgi:hypothetical protein
MVGMMGGYLRSSVDTSTKPCPLVSKCTSFTITRSAQQISARVLSQPL